MSDRPAPGVESDPRQILQLFEQAPGFLCFLSMPDFVFEHANAAYRQLVGHRDLIGKPLHDALPELRGQGFLELLQHVVSTGERFVGRELPALLQRTPGAPLHQAYVDFIYEPIFAPDGSITGILVQGHDVTEKRRLDEERRRAEDIYRAVFESTADGFCLMEMLFDENDVCVDYEFLAANPAFAEHTGLVDAVGKRVSTLVPNLDRSWFEIYGDVARTGQPRKFVNHASAMNRWFEVSATRVGDPAKRHVALVFENITERRAFDQTLQESEQRFRNMADHAPVMLWVTDAEGECTYLNRAWYDTTGQRPEVALGRGWLDAVHPDEVDAVGRSFTESNARQGDLRLEYRLRTKDGDYRWVVDSAVPRRTAEGQFLGYVGTCVDVTEQKRATAEREAAFAIEQAARVEAERANRLKDEFLATVSHELRTPLSAILGWSQLLRGGSLPAERHDDALATIERNARLQSQLIEDLLDVSRILSGKLTLDVGPVDLGRCVEQAVESVRPAADAKDIRLQLATDSNTVVMGDATRLQQVVWNLLSNAVKFTPRGGRVHVVTLRRDSSVEVVVSDTGQGIAPEVLPFVFERFVQADSSSTRAHGGLGLGLSIVKHLAEAHGGTVGASSDGVGRGASFVLRIPLSPAARREVERPTRASTSHIACPPAIAGLRVLVVDDEPDSRDLLRALLEGCDAHVTTASSAEEALAALDREMPQILVSDIGMPGADGHELMRRIRADPDRGPRRLPAVALTAYVRAEDRMQALRSGFQSHVPKPVEPLELLTVIASLAERIVVEP